MKKNIYITTPIYYPSSIDVRFHIGTAYTTIFANTLVRYNKLRGNNVYFLTGMDEHGQKVESIAEKRGITPQEHVDEYAKMAQELWKRMKIEYNDFIRTTEKRHESIVQKIFTELLDKGDIYLGEYEGEYCVGCESFYTKTQLDGRKNCPDCGRGTQLVKEKAYFFRLSKYADRLLKHIEENNDFIVPETKKNEVVNFIKGGLEDLCVSRTSVKWGVPIPSDPEHVIYVWIDALSNYITFIGYDPEGQHEPIFSNLWPADVHIIGKDILRFHVIYWPIMLMALDIPLPKQILGHPWLLSGEEKMSKSKGNIVYADDLVKLFDVDSVRHYMLSQMPYANDGIFTYELIIDKINADLVNNLGNLLNRTISMAYKYFDGIVPEPKSLEEVDNSLIDCVSNARKAINNKMDEYKVSESINLVFDIFNRTNKYIDETMPWALAKDVDKRDRLATVIYNLLETIRIGAVLLQPFLPETSDKIFYQLNTLNKNYDSITGFDGMDVGIKLNQPEPLFLRIDKNKRLEEIENYYKNKR